MNDAPLRKNTL